MSRGLGYLPDLPDARDHDAGPVLRATLRAAPDVCPRSEFIKTVDQGGLGSCTANAGGQAVRADQVRQAVEAGMPLEKAQELEFPSRLFPYRLARAMHGNEKDDTGTYIRNIFKVYNDVGFPPESAWPYSDASGPNALFTRMPSAEAFRLAFDQKQAALNGGNPLVSYRRVFSTGYARAEEIKLAHAKKKLVVFGTHVSQNFCADLGANGGKPIDPPVGLSIAGGHAMVTGGHDLNGVDVLNSWGLGYGDRGWCRFSWDYLTWSNTTDLWVVDCAPIYVP